MVQIFDKKDSGCVETAFRYILSGALFHSLEMLLLTTHSFSVNNGFYKKVAEECLYTPHNM